MLFAQSLDRLTVRIVAAGLSRSPLPGDVDWTGRVSANAAGFTALLALVEDCCFQGLFAMALKPDQRLGLRLLTLLFSLQAMADALKAKGNAAFGAQKWNDAISWWTKAIKLETDDVALASLYSNRSAAHLKVDKYDEALQDAEAAVLKRPTWSKALARMAEVYARQQVFDRSQQCYERAIELAEDDAARKRYEASLATTKAAEKKAEAKNAQPERPVRDGTFDDFYLTKIRLAQFRGEYVLPPEGGVALAVYAADACHEGMLQVDQNLVKVSDSQFQFTPFTDALANLCDCLVTDRSGFYLRPGRDPSFPTERKVSEALSLFLEETADSVDPCRFRRSSRASSTRRAAPNTSRTRFGRPKKLLPTSTAVSRPRAATLSAGPSRPSSAVESSRRECWRLARRIGGRRCAS